MSEVAAIKAPVGSTGRAQAHDAPAMTENLYGLWFFIVVECLVFSSYFIIYMLQRMYDPATFESSQVHLSPTFGLVNTLILLTSSWQVARSLHSARAGDFGASARQALVTIALGGVFILSKVTEWVQELRAGYSFGTNDFFSFYYFLTGIHIVHVLVGFVFMSSAIYRLRSPSPSVDSIEAASVYWHMVDFLWVFIFALLYVMR